MTDEQIIEALECCSTGKSCYDVCPFDDKFGITSCTKKLSNAALNLINRQKAEIESLKQIVEQQDKEILTLQKRIINWRADIDYRPEDIKSEAIKEFVERLKSEYEDEKQGRYINWLMDDIIDNLVKEMTEVSE